MLLNCGVGEDSWASLDCKEIQPVHPKGDQSWVFIGRTDAEAPILWPPDAKNWLTGKDPDAGRLKAEGDDRRWDGWMESLTWWTWVWASSGRWWWTGKPGLLQSMGSKRVLTRLRDWTELNLGNQSITSAAFYWLQVSHKHAHIQQEENSQTLNGEWQLLEDYLGPDVLVAMYGKYNLYSNLIFTR